MSDLNDYRWRCFSGLFRPSIVSFDFANRQVEFRNSLRPDGFFNLFFQKLVQCPFDDIVEVDTYQQNGMKCLSVVTRHGKTVYIASDVPRFDEMVSDFVAALPQRAEF